MAAVDEVTRSRTIARAAEIAARTRPRAVEMRLRYVERLGADRLAFELGARHLAARIRPVEPRRSAGG